MYRNCVDGKSNDESSPCAHLCYVHCNFCETILAVGVPWSRLFKTITVKCGQCNHLLSVDIETSAFPAEQPQREYSGSSSSATSKDATLILTDDKPKSSPLPRSEVGGPRRKRPRMPSMYNTFIKAEIQRIKADNPQIKHKEAFSAAAKNWAHYPHIKFGMKPENIRKHIAEEGSTQMEETMRTEQAYNSLTEVGKDMP